MPPPTPDTTLPMRCLAFSPASVTIPEPSLPTGRGLPIRGFMAHITDSGMSMMTFA